jgi:RAVE protein 1 C terminal
MRKVHLIPKSPNDAKCVCVGCFTGKVMIAYGCGKKVCILYANTLIVHQLTEEYETQVSAVAWARTEGRLAVGLEGAVLVLVPKDFVWSCAVKIATKGAVKEISWSFFGDCFLAVSSASAVWSLNSSLEHNEVWNEEGNYNHGKLSPDGRLIALSKQNKISICYKDGEFSLIKLNHQSNITHMDWKDITTQKLYINFYNPNALIAITEDGSVKIWSEYYSPTGLGFNIVFQMKTINGMAAWIKSYNNLENHISFLAAKYELLKKQKNDSVLSLNSISCLLRGMKTQPEHLLYGAVMKERIPVEWIVIIEENKISFYCCEGIGAYPATSINIKLHIEMPVNSSNWNLYGMPVYALKESDEIQLLGLSKCKDFVRWRKRFEEKNENEFELTTVSGGHSEKIVKVLCHKTLPVLCSIDSSGLGRVWSCVRGIYQEAEAVQHLMNWGVLVGEVLDGKWLDSFALILVARRHDIALFKWKSDTIKDLKSPSMSWNPCVSWESNYNKIDVSELQVTGSSFVCYVVGFNSTEVSVWVLSFDRSFSIKKIWEDKNSYIDCKFYSYLSDYTHRTSYLYTLCSGSLICYNLSNPIAKIWEKKVLEGYKIYVTSIVILLTPLKLVFFAHDGLDQGQFDVAHRSSKIFCFTQERTECLGILIENSLSIIARKSLKIVGESEMEWKHIIDLDFNEPVQICAINNFQQFITAYNTDLQVYVHEKSSKLSLLLSLVSDPKPFFHPLMLQELLKIQKNEIVKSILARLLDPTESINYTLNMSLEDFLNISSAVFNDEMSSKLKDKINERYMEFPGIEGDIMAISQLIGVVDSINVIEAQSRAFDEFAKVFFLNVKMFKYVNEQKIPASMKPVGLTSMEIAWALHSEQQDTLFQILFNNVNDWTQMKMYGMGIWIQNPQKLKKMIEEIAMNDYRKNKEPKNISLWYMALGKKTILTELYKKDFQQVKIYNFLKNDFNNPEWQVKAQKNAFELRKQMKYELSAAFFILGGQTEGAIEVIAESLFDPQLALVIARLKEGDGSPLYQKVIKTYFLPTALKEKDPWLASISYTLLKDYAQSILCVLSLPLPLPFAPKAWNNSTCPIISGFHPCLRNYAKLLKNTIMVKRDCEDKGINLSIVENIEKDIVSRSARAYLRGGLPVLALFEISKSESEYSLVITAVKSYIIAIAKTCEEDQHEYKFKNLVNQVRYCSDKFGIPIRKLIDFVSDIFYKKDLRSYQCGFLVECGLFEKGAEALLHQASIVHVILSRVSRDPCFKCSLTSLKSIAEELSSCMKLLTGTEVQDFHRFQLMQIGISVYLCFFLQSYQTADCISCLNYLQALESYLKTSEFLYLKFPSLENREDKGIVGTWIRYLMTNKLLKVLEKFKCKDIDSWLENSLIKFNLIGCSQDTVECYLAPGRGLKKRALMSIGKLKTRLKSMLRRILLRISSLVSNENMKSVQKLTEIFSYRGNSLPKELTVFFKNFEEYNDFDLYFEGNSQIYRLVQALAQSISSFVYENPGKISEAIEKEGFIYQESIQENVSLFKNGLEVFKSKDPITGFAINSTDKKHLVVLSNSKRDKIREINLEHCFSFKKFTQDLELETEDPETYTECIKQFDNSPSSSSNIFNPSISASLHHLYAPQSEEFHHEMKLPPAQWHRSPLMSLVASFSSFKSRQDKVEKITAHPMLPLYVTGNELLTLWQFNRSESLQDFATSSSSTSKILSIKFNSYGDKLGACDAQGNFYLYKFDLQPTSFQPQLTLKNSSGMKFSNFCFLNLGSVVATIGNKPKEFLSIYDTLLPPTKPAIHTENIGGKLVSFLSRNQQLILSSKRGKLIRYDLRMREVVETYESKHEHMSDMKLGPNEITLITAGTEGMVKIWDARGSTVREVIDVSRKSRNKKISQIECIDNTLFVSTHDGGVKLLRIIQQ